MIGYFISSVSVSVLVSASAKAPLKRMSTFTALVDTEVWCCIFVFLQLELQNDQYRVEADTLRDQVEILRARLHSLPTSTARQIHRRSVQVPFHELR